MVVVVCCWLLPVMLTSDQQNNSAFFSSRRGVLLFIQIASSSIYRRNYECALEISQQLGVFSLLYIHIIERENWHNAIELNTTIPLVRVNKNNNNQRRVVNLIESCFFLLLLLYT